LSKVKHLTGLTPVDMNNSSDQFTKKNLHISGFQQLMSVEAVESLN